MELTIKQILQRGVTAHKEGKLKDAERFYRTILQSQPAHPDANHNLGVLAVSVNKVSAALPLFKTALESNPTVEQFWLSMIDALIKEQYFEDAKQVIQQAKAQGVAEEKLNVLEAQLISINKQEYVDSVNPSDERLCNLLEHYQNGKFGDVETLAISLIKEFPSHNFSWKVLGEVFKLTGRDSEALQASQKAVALSPQDAEAYNNLGITLKELKRLDEAEVKYTQAITLKPDYAEAHSNFGITLQELGRLDEAKASYRQAIALKRDYAEAHNNLGVTLKELGRLKDAELTYRQAIALKPDYAEAHSNFGITLKELGRFDEAEASYTQSIMLKPDLDETYNNLGITLKELGRLDEAEASYKHAITLNSENLKAHNELLKCLYLLDKKSDFFDELDQLINRGKANAIIGSLSCRSALKYGLKKPNIFCKEPLKYVLHTDLNARYDFEKVFTKKAKSILNKNQISNRRQSLLVNGNQTSGNLFDIKNDFTSEIQKVIRFEIEQYRINFKDSEEGFIKKWPTEYSLYGWLISMKSGGELQPHIHEQGWLSGSIYINIPPKLAAHSGNLVVSLGEEKDATDTRINLKKIINVFTGSMVLFPASLMHHTIPFESEQERVVLAFDVKQK